ncbi:MAG: hypothetical protein ACI4HQ_13490 [Acetatifactor sp.]
MKANELLDMIGDVDDSIIKDAKKRKRTIPRRWTKWAAVVACLCLVAVGSVNILLRFDYFKAGCGATAGTIVNGDYYYNVQHSGVWRYSNGNTEKVLSAYWKESWLVNEAGLYYIYGKNLYKMDLETLDRKKIYSATDGTHMLLDPATDGNVIVTVYDKKEKYAYQDLVSGETGEVIEQLTEQVPYSCIEQLYTDLNYRVGERRIALVPIDDGASELKYMPTENGDSLLPEGNWTWGYGSYIGKGVLSFRVYDDKGAMYPEQLLLFADGNTRIIPSDHNYSSTNFSGVIGHILLYVDNENSENYGSNGNGIWCYDSDTDERWQLKIDAECEFYAFTNDENTLYSCVPWSHEQTAWEIIYQGDKPVSLHLIEKDITE